MKMKWTRYMYDYDCVFCVFCHMNRLIDEYCWFSDISEISTMLEIYLLFFFSYVTKRIFPQFQLKDTDGLCADCEFLWDLTAARSSKTQAEISQKPKRKIFEIIFYVLLRSKDRNITYWEAEETDKLSLNYSICL